MSQKNNETKNISLEKSNIVREDDLLLKNDTANYSIDENNLLEQQDATSKLSSERVVISEARLISEQQISDKSITKENHYKSKNFSIEVDSPKIVRNLARKSMKSNIDLVSRNFLEKNRKKNNS